MQASPLAGNEAQQQPADEVAGWCGCAASDAHDSQVLQLPEDLAPHIGAMPSRSATPTSSSGPRSQMARLRAGGADFDPLNRLKAEATDLGVTPVFRRAAALKTQAMP